jgi:NAD(P)-dependent dehydrogenase (short-subunit alcohol dehydrogenase family)
MKYALVTGATNGLGLETARALAAQQYFVLVHGRDPKKGAATVASLKSATATSL